MLFTPEQLLLEGRPLSAQAEEALQARQLDRVRYLLGRMSTGHFELCFGYLHWVARMAGKLHRDFGEPYFNSVMERVARFLMSPYAEDTRQGKEKQVVSQLATLWVHQMGRFESLGETDNEVAFRIAPCGSGGRLLLEGWYESSPELYTRTENGKPVYCRICEHLQQALNRAAGRTFWRVDSQKGNSGFCRMRFLKKEGKGRMLFGADELHGITVPRCKQALQMLDQGVLNIGDLLRDQHTEWRPLHDFYCLFVTGLLSLACEEKGLDYLIELLGETYVRMFESAYSMYSLLDDRTLFRNLVRNWHYHQATFCVTEEEDRFVFHLDPCGSGGRLSRGEMGRPGRFRYGDGLLAEIDEAAHITFHRAPFPSYCTHCAATNRDQFQGKPYAFLVDGSALQTPLASCRQYLYKKSASYRAPPELLPQVGLRVAKPLRKEYRL